MYKKLSASGELRPLTPTRGSVLPLDPAGGSAHRPPFRLALRALAMVRPLGKSWICHCNMGHQSVVELVVVVKL